MKNQEIIKVYRSAGYSINIHKETTIKEPFKSIIDDKIIYIEKAYSSKERDFKFLEDCLKDFNLKI